MFFFEILLTEMAVWNSENHVAYTGLITWYFSLLDLVFFASLGICIVLYCININPAGFSYVFDTVNDKILFHHKNMVQQVPLK